LDLCFKVEVRGQEPSENVCQRLNSLDVFAASTVVSRNLEEEGVQPGTVTVVRWDTDPNPIAANPGNLNSGISQPFLPPSAVNLG